MRALLPLRFPHKIEKTPEKFIYHETINWFPGHMMKATREMRNRLGYTALVLEIRDARVSFESYLFDISSFLSFRILQQIPFWKK